MKCFSHGLASVGQILVFIVLVLCLSTNALRLPLLNHQAASSIHGKTTKLGDKVQMQPKEDVGMEVYPSGSGSSLPDCSHACGPCFPCKRVMVSFFKCSMAESCPIVYRCMCKGKYYHVPSN